MNKDILIVDDEKDIRVLISDILKDEDYSPRVASNSDQALAELSKGLPDLVLLDIWLEGSKLDGLELLNQIHLFYPNIPCIMISGHGNIDIAVKAIKGGASDFIEKPFESERLIFIIDRVLELFRLKKENKELWIRSGGPIELVGNSIDIKRLQTFIDKIAPTGSRILITGEAGTGKETVARLIHQRSRRYNGPFVVLNAPLLIAERMEEMLFGEEDKAGRIVKFGLLEQANNGTLFMDEVSSMPLETQRTIIRVLQDQSFIRKNGAARVTTDIRVISSSSVDLEGEIRNKNFSEDLYYRLNVVPIKLSPLSARKDDIPDLINFFMKKYHNSSEAKQIKFSSAVVNILQSFNWPGNVRQLRNTIERIMILVDDPSIKEITLEMLPNDLLSENKHTEIDSNYAQTLPLKEARKLFEYDYINSHLERFNGNISKTAEFIGMERSALHRKLNSLTEVKNIKKTK